MKKTVAVIILAASFITIIYLTRFLGNPVNYSDCIVSETQAYELMAARREAINLLDSLVFNEEVLFFDIYSDTFYYSLIENDQEAFTPDIKIKGKTENVSIAILEKEITEDLIRNNQTITILAYTDEFYGKYYLKCTTLPLMSINCAEDISTDNVSMNMTLFDNSERTAGRLIFSDGNIHMRGRTARTYPKSGYRISLIQESVGGNTRPNHVSLLGMRQDDDWLLYAAYNDQEKIRNVFSSNLWKYTCAADNEPGIDIGMEYKYLELFVNDEYLGLYALGYPIDEKQVGISSESDESYIIKHGLINERLQFDKNGDVGYESVKADLTDSELSKLADYYYNLYLNADNNENLYSGIDIDNAIDFYLFTNLIQGIDNVDLTKNYYILLQDRPEGIKAFYAPWDLDLTWGNNFSFFLPNYTYVYEFKEDFNCIIGSGYIYQLIVNDDSVLWEKIFTKYKQLRETGWSEEYINSLLDKYETDIYGSGAYLRDMERWPEGNYSNASEGLGTFRKYVMRRLREADLYYERLERIYHENDNIFIRRSAGYKDFPECSFIIEINNRDLLKDSDYTDFLEYMGIDIACITEDIHYILANPAEGKFEYLSSLNMDEGDMETCIGTLSFDKVRDGNYIIRLNGVYCYETSLFFEPEVEMRIVKDNNVYTDPFSFSKGYDMMEQMQTDVPGQLQVYLRALSETNYYSVIEINNPDIWHNSDYIRLFEALGITGGDIHGTTDFIIWNGSEKTAVVLDNFHVSGSTYESSLCSFAVFWNEAGAYGAYLNGNECFVSSDEDNRNVDVRIALLDPETYDLVDMQTYLFE